MTVFMKMLQPLSRPKAPDRQVVTCAYDGEELHISFLIHKGTATLSVTDETLLTATYEFDTTSRNLQIQGNPEFMFQQYKGNIENLYITL